MTCILSCRFFKNSSYYTTFMSSPHPFKNLRCKMGGQWFYFPTSWNILLFYHRRNHFTTVRRGGVGGCVLSRSVISDSLQPPGLYGRLLCPWDFPGKNIGVGCHFLLQGIFPTQRLNLCLLHWQEDSLQVSHLESLFHHYPSIIPNHDF